MSHRTAQTRGLEQPTLPFETLPPELLPELLSAPSSEQLAKFDEFAKFDEQQINRYDRIDTLVRLEDGFFAASLEEQVEVIGLRSFIISSPPYGAAKHLAEVATRQKNVINRAVLDPSSAPLTDSQKDNMRAPRKLTRQYADWAKDAKQRQMELKALGLELEYANPELVLNRVIDPAEPEKLGLLLAFMRDFDIDKLSKEGINAVGYDPQKVDYSVTNPGIMYYASEAAATWRVHQVKQRLPDVLRREANRQKFFTDRLTEVDEFYPILRPITRPALDELHDRVD